MLNNDFQLLHDLQHGNAQQRLTAASALARQPHKSHIEAFKVALSDENDPVAREAARALGKLGSIAETAVPDLIDSATRPWTLGCPQRFPQSIEALVRITPENERLVPIIQDTIKCSNYQIQKSCLLALVQIGSNEAIDTFLHLDRYWKASPKTLPFKKLVRKLLDELETSNAIGGRLDEKAALLAWLEAPTGRRQFKSSN